MANSKISIFSKKVIRANTENSLEVGLFVTSLIHLFKFKVIAGHLPVYEITNRGLVGIGCQFLQMATNNLLIDYQCTIIMALIKFLPIMIRRNW